MGFDMTPDGCPPFAMPALQSVKEPEGALVSFETNSPSLGFVSSSLQPKWESSRTPLAAPLAEAAAHNRANLTHLHTIIHPKMY
jgi:hypothetical protein